MQAPEVQQLALLSEIFGNVLRERKPASVAVLGIAGGNGLEHIDTAVTRRICGIDIHPEYLAVTRQRFAGLPGLELHCIDLAADDVTLAPVELVHAALVFEHAGWGKALESAVELLIRPGILSVVLQLPSTQTAGVSGTAFASMQTLASGFRFIEPAAFCDELAQRGLALASQSTHPLPAGKAFWSGVFEKRP